MLGAWLPLVQADSYAPAPFLGVPNFWGPHFPRSYWGPHFPWPQTLLLATPDSPAGVATFVLGPATATYSNVTDVFKARSGKERRANLLDRPKEIYKGTAHLVGGDVRSMRGLLARYAATATVFQLGLGHESVSITTPSSTTVANVNSTALLDWALPGVRVLVVAVQTSGPRLTLPAVIQAVGASTLTLDVALGALGVVGATIMPTVPVYLDSTQGFGRHSPAEPVEDWQVSTRSIRFGYRSVAVAASLVPPTLGVLAGLRIIARAAGAAGNTITVRLQAATLPVGVNVSRTEDVTAKTVLVRFRAGAATVLQVYNAITGSTLVGITGTYTPTDLLNSGTDEFGPTALAGGVDSTLGAVGRGASLTMYDGRPVYDRGLEVKGTASDSLQSLTELIDLGAVPLNVGDTTVADWGRQAMLTSNRPADRQWLKLFLSTVAGRFKSFWLPSWRADLIPSGITGAVAAVAATLPLAVALPSGSGALAGLTLTAVPAGSVGNGYRVSFTADGATSTGSYSTGAGLAYVKYVPGVTTVQNIVDLLALHTELVTIAGSYTGATTLAASDEFVNVAMWGGADAVGSKLTVSQSATSGDYGAWITQRDRLQLKQADGTITYAKILSTFTAGSTYTLSLDATLSGSAVALVSWLELCRFESDDVAMSFQGPTFSLNQQARVVQR